MPSIQDTDTLKRWPMPYYAVIFTSILHPSTEGYEAMAKQMVDLAHEQPGFLGVESARERLGITVSYWQSPEHIRLWREHATHKIARQMGRTNWYQCFRVRVCKVEHDYGFPELNE